MLAWFVDHRTDWSIRVAKLLGTTGAFVTPGDRRRLLIGIWLWRRGSHVLIVAAPLASVAARWLSGRQRWPSRCSSEIVLRLWWTRPQVTLASFPSGHATNFEPAFGIAVGLTLALTIAHRRSAKVILVAGGLLFAVLVGVSRLVLGGALAVGCRGRLGARQLGGAHCRGHRSGPSTTCDYSTGERGA